MRGGERCLALHARGAEARVHTATNTGTGFGLRDLRHYFATVLIFGGANVKTVQLAMGHTTPTITLNTYVGYWPDALDRTRSLVESALVRPSTVDVKPEGVHA